MRVQYLVSLSMGLGLLCYSLPVRAADQTVPGAGNGAAISLGNQSPLVQSAVKLLEREIARLRNSRLKSATLDALTNSSTCVTHRANLSDSQKSALLQQLLNAGLVNPADDATFPGGLKAGVFPPLVNDGSPCPQLPQLFSSAPGSVFGGHHSYPGGLTVHEAFNEISDLNFASGYQHVYGNSGPKGLPVVKLSDEPSDTDRSADFFISADIIIAAPLWHDWAKTMVFQWNSDGTEFKELNFGGNGTTDNYGAAGDSRTGGHHIIGVAEAMKRGLPPDFVITQASAHSAPTSGNEFKVVNWLRAAAILAQIDPVAQGYLSVDSQGRLRLPPLRQLGSLNLNAATPSQTNLLVEYALHNLSDADFTFTGPAISTVQVLLQTLAPQFGYDPSDTATYNNRFRNPVLSYLSGERLLILYGNGRLDRVKSEVNKLRRQGII